MYMSLQRLAYIRTLKGIRKAKNFQSFVPIILEFHILLTRETNGFMHDAHTAIECVFCADINSSFFQNKTPVHQKYEIYILGHQNP